MALQIQPPPERKGWMDGHRCTHGEQFLLEDVTGVADEVCDMCENLFVLEYQCLDIPPERWDATRELEAVVVIRYIVDMWKGTTFHQHPKGGGPR